MSIAGPDPPEGSHELDASLSRLDERLAEIERELSTVGRERGLAAIQRVYEPELAGSPERDSAAAQSSSAPDELTPELVGERSPGTHVTLDAGPFADLATLVSFEAALCTLPEVGDARVRAYVRRRAVIDVRLARAPALLDAMRQRLPYRFAVVAAGAESLTLAVDARGSEPGADRAPTL